MRKKRFIWMSAICLALSVSPWTSCQKIMLDDESGQKEGSRQVKFQLLTPSASRATSAADFKSVWVMDVVDDKVVQIVTQKAGDTHDFGSPTLNLSSGQHTLKFFASDQFATRDNDLIVQQPLGDTFVKSLTVNTEKLSDTQRVILERQVAKVVYKGEGNATFAGIRYAYDLHHTTVSDETYEAVLQQNEYLYTLIPEDKQLTLEDGTEVPVQANQVTLVYGDGSHEGGEEDSSEPEYDEILVLETDTALIYASENEIGDVSLAEYPDPATSLADEMGIYRIPTRREAFELHEVTLPGYFWTGDRCLCYDSPADAGETHGSTKLGTGKYYTFLWGSGSITSAGQKTSYSIIPIRSVPLSSLAQSFTLSADFTWNTDTVVVK